MDIGELARLLKRPSWLEGDQTGFHMDVDAALWAEAACFKWDFDPADTVKSMVFEIEWIGEGSTASDINRDFYRVCGRFTEDAQFIGRIVEGDHIRYDVVVGSDTHGHIATFKVIGERAGGVARRYADNRNKTP